MANRGVICPTCGFMRRVACESLRGTVGIPPWPTHCGTAMLILGYRQSQAATQLAPQERVRWVALGGPIRQGRGRKRWQPILSESRLGERFPSS
jgi:hypothetical protein